MKRYTLPAIVAVLILCGFAVEYHSARSKQDWWQRCTGREYTLFKTIVVDHPQLRYWDDPCDR